MKIQQRLHCGNVAAVTIAMIVVAVITKAKSVTVIVVLVVAVEVKVAWHQWLTVLKRMHGQ